MQLLVCELAVFTKLSWKTFSTKRQEHETDDDTCFQLYIFLGFPQCVIKHFLAALQRHYAVLQALALDEEDMPETKDETLPDEEGMAR